MRSSARGRRSTERLRGRGRGPGKERENKARARRERIRLLGGDPARGAWTGYTDAHTHTHTHQHTHTHTPTHPHTTEGPGQNRPSQARRRARSAAAAEEGGEDLVGVAAARHLRRRGRGPTGLALHQHRVLPPHLQRGGSVSE